jgi:hypothetical protein
LSAKPLCMTDCVDCWAVPGANSIIDVIHPVTGRTWINGNTPAEMLAREPRAVRMVLSDWLAEKAARQQTPITWTQTTEATYREMLDVLPPAAWVAGYFLVGEPTDHCAATGAPRFQGYRETAGRYFASSRPITLAELRAIVTR